MPVVKATVSMEVLPFSFSAQPTATPTAPAAALPTQHMGAGAKRILATLLQWGATTDPRSGRSSHTAHAVFDVVLSQPAFRKEYARLKAEYGQRWVAAWPEQTDPAKFVYARHLLPTVCCRTSSLDASTVLTSEL